LVLRKREERLKRMADKGKKDGATPAEAPFTMNTTGAAFSLGTAPAGQGDLPTADVTVSSSKRTFASSQPHVDIFDRHKLET
jgi:hypothetical protein